VGGVARLERETLCSEFRGPSKLKHRDIGIIFNIHEYGKVSYTRLGKRGEG
jgi:hypothetical protein